MNGNLISILTFVLGLVLGVIAFFAYKTINIKKAEKTADDLLCAGIDCAAAHQYAAGALSGGKTGEGSRLRHVYGNDRKQGNRPGGNLRQRDPVYGQIRQQLL